MCVISVAAIYPETDKVKKLAPFFCAHFPPMIFRLFPSRYLALPVRNHTTLLAAMPRYTTFPTYFVDTKSHHAQSTAKLTVSYIDIDYSHGRKRSVAAARHHSAPLADRRERVQCRLSDHLAGQQDGDA